MPGQFSVVPGTGIFVFLGISGTLWAAYTAWLWRRIGRTAPRRVVARSAFTAYVGFMWGLVLLPFPDANVLVEPAPVNLVPFAWLVDARAGVRYAGGGLGALLTNRTLVYVLSNIVLTMPLGAALRRSWRWDLRRTTAVAFALSLAFELTQLTGVWGLFAMRYRTFDVDDLVTNTAGGMLGWLLVPLLRKVPARRAGTAASRRRRPGWWVAAFGIDVTVWIVLYLLAWLVTWTAVVALGGSPAPEVAIAVWLGAAAVVFVGLPLWCRGATPGMALLDLPARGAGRATPSTPGRGQAGT